VFHIDLSTVGCFCSFVQCDNEFVVIFGWVNACVIQRVGGWRVGWLPLSVATTMVGMFLLGLLCRSHVGLSTGTHY